MSYRKRINLIAPVADLCTLKTIHTNEVIWAVGKSQKNLFQETDFWFLTITAFVNFSLENVLNFQIIILLLGMWVWYIISYSVDCTMRAEFQPKNYENEDGPYMRCYTQGNFTMNKCDVGSCSGNPTCNYCYDIDDFVPRPIIDGVTCVKSYIISNLKEANGARNSSNFNSERSRFFILHSCPFNPSFYFQIIISPGKNIALKKNDNKLFLKKQSIFYKNHLKKADFPFFILFKN
ncbi:hypothetical protein BY996DRAFT_4228696 [Phakopsora pachyrhizi]|nr:hypothetical protein BY996DRAFT_4228696 [Phakopsora pachyrhizi]